MWIKLFQLHPTLSAQLASSLYCPNVWVKDITLVPLYPAGRQLMAAIQSWHCVWIIKETLLKKLCYSGLSYTSVQVCRGGWWQDRSHFSHAYFTTWTCRCFGQIYSLSVILQCVVFFTDCADKFLMRDWDWILQQALWSKYSLFQHWLSTALCWTRTCNADSWNLQALYFSVGEINKQTIG